MDNAVALVRSYLHVNGYFTVTEYPVFEAAEYGGYRTVTDLDLLAFRFAGAGQGTVGVEGPTQTTLLDADAELGTTLGQADMIVGEVKEGQARLNDNMIQPAVLTSVLTRFGCCEPKHAHEVVSELIRTGTTTTPTGHRLRLVVFASVVESTGHPGCQVVSLAHVVRFLQDYLSLHWDILHNGQFKDPAFGFLMTLKKAMDAESL